MKTRERVGRKAVVFLALGMGVLWCEVQVLEWMLEPGTPASENPARKQTVVPAGQAA